jgi:hypothetical protein
MRVTYSGVGSHKPPSRPQFAKHFCFQNGHCARTLEMPVPLCIDFPIGPQQLPDDQQFPEDLNCPRPIKTRMPVH